MANWEDVPPKIIDKMQAEYLSNETPNKIAEKYKKYGLTVKQISNKADKSGWTIQKNELNKQKEAELLEKTRKKNKELIELIEVGTHTAVMTLYQIANDEDAKYSDRVNACKAILDISGLKTSTVEQKTNSNQVQVVFINQDDKLKAKQHIEQVLNE